MVWLDGYTAQEGFFHRAYSLAADNELCSNPLDKKKIYGPNTKQERKIKKIGKTKKNPLPFTMNVERTTRRVGTRKKKENPNKNQDRDQKRQHHRPHSASAIVSE
jgi:hypothetical protein